MGVHQETGGRVHAREGNSESRVRVEAKCEQCGEAWYFYRYPKQPRPEYGVCSDCAVKNWLKTYRVAVP